MKKANMIKRPNKRLMLFLTSLSGLALLTTTYGFIWYICYAQAIVQPFFRKGNWLVIAIYALMLYIFMRIYGGFRIGYLKRSDVIYSAILSMLITNVLNYLQIGLIGRRFMNFVPILILTITDIFILIIWAFFSEKLYYRLYPPRRILLIYGGNQAEDLLSKMSSRSEKYNICGAIAVTEGLESICQAIGRYEAVLICDVKSDMRNELLKYCFRQSVRVYLTLKLSDTIIRGAEAIHLFDSPLLLCRNKGLDFGQQAAKRILDLAISSTALVLTSPIMAMIAIMIKCYDRGPVLYQQERLTEGGRIFTLYKFRSMVVDAERLDGPRLASENDQRITPIGKILRMIRLDELPQLINIIKGEMSIVGPRPERKEIAQQYALDMPEFDFRLKVKAGLTGYAQVYGKYNTSPHDKLKMDLTYIEGYSLWLDIKIILMTIKVLFTRESSQGIPDDAPNQLFNRGEKPRMRVKR
ncbi:sugar transferase [Anaerotruncus colihominis]|uniref:sugar transferase n=1 Tax=Anaerotruncus colihominis TaxID=169435 RepID=UPI003515645F